MKTSMRSTVLTLLAPVALLVAALPAAASTLADCQLEIVALSEQTAATTFLRGDKGVKTELQLLHHLSNASKELDQADFREALRQMDSYSTSLARAVESVTVAPADAAALQTGADAVVSCVQQIQ